MLKFLYINSITFCIKRIILSLIYAVKFRKSKLIIGYPSYIKNSNFNSFISIYDNIIIDTLINDYTFIAKKTEIYNCEIGKFCSIGQYSIIGLSSHPKDFVSTSPLFYSKNGQLPIVLVDKSYYNDSIKKTLIGNDVWIGCNVTIVGGITIGDGAIIASGSVVTKDVKPYEIVGGIPSKHISYRFSEEKINFLIKTKWYETFTLSELTENFKSFHNIDEFIKLFKEKNNHDN